jgi:HlyD family secretion protein
LHAITEQSVGFPQGGRVTAIDVSVGERVTAGQPLAKIDDTAQKIALRNSQDEVTRQQAVLDQTRAQNTPGRASAELQRWHQLLDTTQRVADRVDRADAAAIDRLQRQLRFDEYNLRRLGKERRVDRGRCPDYPNSPPSSGATATITTPGSSSGSSLPGDEGPCEFLESRFDSIAAAQRQIISDHTEIENARRRRETDRVQQQVSIENLRVNLILAENKRGLAGIDTRYTVLQQQQSLDEARNNLILAQQAVGSTVVKASFTGTVARINGGVGKVVTAAYRTGLPAAADSGGSAGGAMASDSPSDALIVLDGINSFEMTVPFTKADVARIAPDQAVDVSFPVVPGLSRKAMVTKIAPAPAAASGDENYLVTLVLTQLDPRLQDGMAAEAHLVTGVVANALVVPAAAVHGIGRTGSVVVVGPDSVQRDVSVQIGAVGEQDAQVLSGLREGEQVLVPQTG